MASTYLIEKTQRIAYFSHSGKIQIETVSACYKRFFNDPDSTGCNRIVANLTDADLSGITNEELERLVMYIEENRLKLRNISIAYIAPLDLQYGLMRVWLAIIGDDLFRNIRLFRFHEPAMFWINSLETLPSRPEKHYSLSQPESSVF